jgi:hypothetical protein
LRIATNFDPAEALKMRSLLRRPVGTYEFTYRSDWLFDAESGGDGLILQIPTGAHLFRLERQPDLTLAFLHAAPTTGTRIASIDLRTLEPSDAVFIAFSWSPSEAKLYVGSYGIRADRSGLRAANASLSDRRISVHESGTIQELGPGVIGARVQSGERTIFAPSATESWSDVKEAIRVLLSGSSADAMYRVIVGNQVISMLNTGFESFARTRFVELEREGWGGDFDALVAEFVPARWRAQEDARIKTEAEEAGRTPLWQFAETRRIDFGNYENARRAYKAAFGMTFGVDLGLPNTDLEQVQRHIQYRQRILHVSPIIGYLNSPEFAKGEEPVFSGLAQAERAVELFDRFITAFHTATLRIRLPS